MTIIVLLRFHFTIDIQMPATRVKRMLHEICHSGLYDDLPVSTSRVSGKFKMRLVHQQSVLKATKVEVL